MPKKIVDKAKHILTGIQFDFEIAFNWDSTYYERYYKYFSHPDGEIRKWSLLIFVGGLGNWRLESACIFSLIEGEKTYQFEDYVQSFLDNRVAIKQEFPRLYDTIVWYLLWLDNRKPFDTIFTSNYSYPSYKCPKKQLFNELRQVLTESGICANELQNNHIDVMEELGLTLKSI